MKNSDAVVVDDEDFEERVTRERLKGVKPKPVVCENRMTSGVKWGKNIVPVL